MSSQEKGAVLLSKHGELRDGIAIGVRSNLWKQSLRDSKNRSMELNSQDEEIVCRNVQVVKYASFSTAMLTVLALATHQHLGLAVPTLVSSIVLLSCILLFLNSFLCDRHISAGLSATLLLATIPLIVGALAWNTGGLNAPVMLLLVVMPVLAAMTRGSQSIVRHSSQ